MIQAQACVLGRKDQPGADRASLRWIDSRAGSIHPREIVPGWIDSAGGQTDPGWIVLRAGRLIRCGSFRLWVDQSAPDQPTCPWINPTRWIDQGLPGSIRSGSIQSAGSIRGWLDRSSGRITSIRASTVRERDGSIYEGWDQSSPGWNDPVGPASRRYSPTDLGRILAAHGSCARI